MGREEFSGSSEVRYAEPTCLEIARSSPYALLVTWQRIQSPLPALAKMIAGRSFD